jgi:hypothetical protein
MRLLFSPEPNTDVGSMPLADAALQSERDVMSRRRAEAAMLSIMTCEMGLSPQSQNGSLHDRRVTSLACVQSGGDETIIVVVTFSVDKV